MAAAVAIGLDLAWSARNATGACALDAGGEVVAEGWLGGDGDVIGWVERFGGVAVVAVDAPLWVPNEGGKRPCESEITSVYGGGHAGAHSSNRAIFARYGGVRGERLAAALAPLGFGDPWAGRAGTLVEVYPHPGLIEVFGLPERLPYKRKARRPVAETRAALRALAAHLDSLTSADPPLRAPPLVIGDNLAGGALKAAEDLLDARFCAWTALLWHRHGRKAFTMYGDAASGHIAVPRRPAFRPER